MSKKLLLITPIFYSDVSGASIYYQSLMRYLSSYDLSVSIISEKYSGISHYSYFGLFPQRASRSKKKIKDYLSYFFQNIKYLYLISLIDFINPQYVLVHSSFYNYPGIFAWVMDNIIEKNKNCVFILDVRDRLMPKGKIKFLKKYFKIIACSGNVYNYLRNNGVPVSRLELIPVIQEPIHVDHSRAMAYLNEINLNVPYILYVGLIKKEKAVDLLLEVFVNYISKIDKEIFFVLVGTLKSCDKKILKLLKHPKIIYLNNRTHQEILYLMYFAKLCINISPNEGLPRASLEAIALKRPVLLPPNISEFERYCQKLVVKTYKPQDIAKIILKAYDNPDYICNTYPIQQHYPENVLPKYLELLR